MIVSVIGTRGFPLVEGGVEKHCELLYPRIMNDIQFRVYRRRSYVSSDISYENIIFKDLPSTKLKGFETVIHSFLASIDSIIHKPDLVHYHNIGPALFSPLMRICGIPVVLTYHSPNYEHKKWGFFARKLLFFSEKVALNFANKIVFVNKFQMEKYNEKVKQKSVYIPNGIVEPIVSLGCSYLEEINVEKNKYILSVGRITQEKGFDVLIKAYNRVRPKGYKLVIAGGVEFESGYMEELKKLCENNEVIFTGYVYGEKLQQLYSHAALYVLSSYNEGFPLVLLEAMSYQLDVVVSDIPATHLVELSKEDYFEKGNDVQLAERIIKKMDCIGKRKYPLREFKWNRIADEMGNIFREIKRDRNENIDN